MDRRVERWITQSVYHHFADSLSEYKVFLEGEFRDTNTVDKWFEVRMDGPWFTIRRTEYLVTLQINIFVAAKIVDDLLIIDRMLGLARTMMETDISICRYGTDEDEDTSVIGCLELNKGRHGDIIINRFGQIDKDAHLVQATIEGHYKATLKLVTVG